MVIYEFTTWNFKNNDFNGLFGVEEIEVEEKTRIYVGKGCRIKKDEIGKLQSSFGNKMYLLENNPKTYINAMIERCKGRVDTAEKRLASARQELDNWNALAERKE